MIAAIKNVEGGLNQASMRIILTLLSGLLMVGCESTFSFDGPPLNGNGETLEVSRSAKAFDRFEFAGSLSAELRIAEDHRITLRTDSNIHDAIKIEIEQGVLSIRNSRDIRPTEFSLLIEAPSLDAAELSGASVLRLQGLQDTSLQLDLRGASAASLQGEIQELQLDMSGAANVSAEQLGARRIQVDGSGASTARVAAAERIAGRLSGASELTVVGAASEVAVDTTGASQIHFE